MITAQMVQNAIARVELNYIRGTTTVVCALVLVNDHVVIGTAHAAPGTEFDLTKGGEYARDKAEGKVAELLACEQRGPLISKTH